MAQVIPIPLRAAPNLRTERLQTQGIRWTTQEKKLLDQAEFLEAMILVLDDVRTQNICNRDYTMMEIINEEIPRYEERLDGIRHALANLRRDYEHSRAPLARQS
jgi:hypothetical protein